MTMRLAQKNRIQCRRQQWHGSGGVEGRPGAYPNEPNLQSSQAGHESDRHYIQALLDLINRNVPF
jgi:hypothetical protein